MPLKTLGIMPHGGYRKREKHSLIAIRWLKYLSVKENLDIQHARNGGEVHVLNYRVDGQLRTDPKQLFEFYGFVHSFASQLKPE